MKKAEAPKKAVKSKKPAPKKAAPKAQYDLRPKDESHVDTLFDRAALVDDYPEQYNSNEMKIMKVGEPVKSPNGGDYYVVSKVGCGASSLAWLVIDCQQKKFKVIKLLKYDCSFSIMEIETLKRAYLEKHANIVKMFENFAVKRDGKITELAVYEPLGQNLADIISTSSNNCVSLKTMKKVAKDILTAFQFLHDECGVVHGDIKPQNIVGAASQKELAVQLRNTLKSNKPLTALNMQCDVSVDDKKIRKELLKLLWNLKADDGSRDFKLIDFGHAEKKNKEVKPHQIGTYGYHPPEQLFRDPLAPGFDIWALGITLLELMNGECFMEFDKEKSEVEQLRVIFGCLYPISLYPLNFDPEMDDDVTPDDFQKKIREFLDKKIQGRKMAVKDHKDLLDFLSKMLHIVPAETKLADVKSKRNTAKQLLAHPFLKNIK